MLMFDFRHKNYCYHIYKLRNCQNTSLELRSILARNVTVGTSEDLVNAWVAMKIPPCEFDEHVAWFVYKSAFVDTGFSASACVTLDCRPKRMRLGFRSRLQCRRCPGRTASVGMCAHVPFVMNTILADTNATTQDDIDAIEWKQTVMLPFYQTWRMMKIQKYAWITTGSINQA